MTPNDRMKPPTRQIFIRIGLALAVLRLTGFASEATAETLTNDPCGLLKAAEIQTLDANAKISAGAVDTSMAPLGLACTYTWGPRTAEWGESGLTVTVIDSSKGWAGVSPDVIEQGILAKVKTGGPNASVVAGVGDAAAFTFESRASNATAEAYFKAKGVHLAVTFHAGDSLANKDKVIALLKDAAARL